MRQFLHLLRIRQWHKNMFVFIGIIYSSQLFDAAMFFSVVLAVLSFCLISSAVYIFNDMLDVEKDRLHPKKKNRPIASGAISPKIASVISIACAFLSFLIAFTVSYSLIFIIFFYLVMNIAYTVRLKEAVILDVFCIAFGFILRITAGTVGVGIEMSKWLMICGMMVALFLGFAKRAAELMAMHDIETETRKVLQNYKGVIVNQLIAICATGVIITYSLYTMSEEAHLAHGTKNLIFTVPLVIYGIFRYLFLLHRGWAGGSPGRDIFRDKQTLTAFLLFIALTLVLIY